MAESVKHSASVRDALAGLKQGDGDTASADKAYKELTTSCNACHEVYRND
jgi:cytochrome c556